MTRLLFPDEGSRLAYRVRGSDLRAVADSTATLYSDAAGTILADVRSYDGTLTPGPVIPGSVVTVDAYSRLPLFWGPDAVDTLYAVIYGGPPAPVTARFDERIDALEAEWIGATEFGRGYLTLTGPVTPSLFGGTKALLDAGLSATVMTVGDSTLGGTQRCIYRFAQWLATQYPNNTVNLRAWNIVNLDWDAPTAIQSGSAGARRIVLTGATTSIITAPTTFNNITGDIDLRAKINPATWASVGTILAKFAAGGTRSYRFQLAAGGNVRKLSLDWSVDGTAIIGPVISSVAVPFADGTPGWVRVTLQVDDGGGNRVIKFYTSTDGATWTQLGSTTTTAGVTSIFASTSQPIEAGARSLGQSEQLTADFYAMEVRKGIGGPITCPTLPDSWAATNSNLIQAPVGAPVIDIWNGSWSGATLGVNLVPNQVKMLPPINADAVIVCDSHNETSAAYDYWASLDTLINYGISANLGASVGVTAQNPKTAPTNARVIAAHARRCTQIAAYAAGRGYSLVDAYRAFNDSPLGLPALTDPDGTHPKDPEGNLLWRDVLTAIWPRR